MPRTKTPAKTPRINVPVPRAVRARAAKKAKGEGKDMSQLVTMLLKDYVAGSRPTAQAAAA